MGVEIIADQDDLFRIWIVDINKLLYLFRPVHFRSSLLDCNPSPSPKGLREHEAAAGAVADVFMVDLLGVVVFGKGNGLSGIGMEFYGLFIHTYHRSSRVILARVYL